MKINPKNVKKATQLDHSINPMPEMKANSLPNLSDSPSAKLFALGVTQVGLFEFSRLPYSTQPSNPS